LKRISGTVKNTTELIIGSFSKTNNFLHNNRIVYCTKKPLLTSGILAYIVPEDKSFKTSKPIFETQNNIPFKNGDVISINSDGFATVVLESSSPHNALYVTDICNSKCIMCPQIESSLSRYNECLKILDIVNLKKYNNIGITGGEPTLNINKLKEILEKIAKKQAYMKVHILTNGRNFANIENVKKLVNIKNINLSFGIPLYSDIAEEHDFIVGVKGAFAETIQGLYNLAKFNQNIEIRTVILKQNYFKLSNLAEYIYRNLPFVSHVALMGMEYHGNAKNNYKLIAIDPIEYKNELFEAIRSYIRYNMVVDIYNIPLCLVDKRIRTFCCDSISTWKKTYLPQCGNCSQKEFCSGVFETSFIQSKNIGPI
jgi:His-Xaa-Ser system radical SAM maturase HxsC